MVDFTIKSALEIEAWCADLRINVNNCIVTLGDDRQYRLNFGAALITIYIDLRRIFFGMQREADIDHKGGAVFKANEGIGHVLDRIMCGIVIGSLVEFVVLNVRTVAELVIGVAANGFDLRFAHEVPA
ncbi:hypothetical protein D3C77_481180 [compost metagenome]